LLFASSFVLGFFLTSAMPIAMQYAAEVTQPTPEGTSNGLIQLFGQGAVVFVFIMEALKTEDGSFTPALLLAVGLLLISGIFVSQMKDPNLIAISENKAKPTEKKSTIKESKNTPKTKRKK
jgi:hypothetical protein